MAKRFGWSETVATHFSAAISSNGRRFLLNTKWRYFSTITASDLTVVDLDEIEGGDVPDLDPSALTMHGTIHAALPGARVLLHCHTDYAAALSTFKDLTIQPIHQNTCWFYERFAHDLSFGGLADTEDEGVRLAAAMGTRGIMMMGKHGVLVSADSVS